jgi:hypothetical protein
VSSSQTAVGYTLSIAAGLWGCLSGLRICSTRQLLRAWCAAGLHRRGLYRRQELWRVRRSVNNGPYCPGQHGDFISRSTLHTRKARPDATILAPQHEPHHIKASRRRRAILNIRRGGDMSITATLLCRSRLRIESYKRNVGSREKSTDSAPTPPKIEVANKAGCSSHRLLAQRFGFDAYQWPHAHHNHLPSFWQAYVTGSCGG